MRKSTNKFQHKKQQKIILKDLNKNPHPQKVIEKININILRQNLKIKKITKIRQVVRVGAKKIKISVVIAKIKFKMPLHINVLGQFLNIKIKQKEITVSIKMIKYNRKISKKGIHF